MELEISIEDLLNKRRVESDRIEFKNYVHANPEQERELINMTNYAPLDARPNFDLAKKSANIVDKLSLIAYNLN